MALTAPQVAGPQAASAEDELDPPLPFGRYQLSRRLGHGGFATVFLALEAGARGEHREVVLKRLHEHLSMDARAREAFLDEARLAMGLSHPNVVSALDFGSIEGRPFLAMEYLLGADLERVLERMRGQGERLRTDVALQIAYDTLEGLAYLHERRDAQGRPAPVVHRDVSPHNLFVTQEGVVKLLDFGIAKARVRAIETTTGVIKGKFAYMAPEQANGEQVEPSADVWSMGVVLWEMLSGQRLFDASSAFSSLASSMQAAIPRLDELCEVPRAVADVVQLALARAPDERLQNGRAMLDALRAAAGSLQVERTQVAELVGGLFADALGRAREQSAHRQVKARRVLTAPMLGSRRVLPWAVACAAVALSVGVLALRREPSVESSRRTSRAAPMEPLPPLGEAPAATAPEPSPQPAPSALAASSPERAPDTGESRRASPRPGSKVASRAAVSGRGRLTLVTVPWSHVELNGKRLGTTPLVDVELPAGQHTLVLDNPESGAHRTLELTIVAGESVQRRMALQPDTATSPPADP